MRALHYVNSALWFVNSVLWTFYAGSILMGVASLSASGVSAYIGWSTDAWT